MRLQLSFVLLLLIASISTGVIWKNLATAREGEELARVMVFPLALLAAVSMVLLMRIVIKVKSHGGRREE